MLIVRNRALHLCGSGHEGGCVEEVEEGGFGGVRGEGLRRGRGDGGELGEERVLRVQWRHRGEGRPHLGGRRVSSGGDEAAGRGGVEGRDPAGSRH